MIIFEKASTFAKKFIKLLIYQNKMNIKKLILSLLLLSIIFVFIKCAEKTDNPKPNSSVISKAKNKNASNFLIAQELNGKIELMYNQQQLKNAIILAYQKVEEKTVSVTSDIILNQEINTETKQIEYWLEFSLLNDQNEYETFTIDVQKQGTEFALEEVGKSCASSTCTKCSRKCSCKATYGTCYSKPVKGIELVEVFETELL